MHLAAYLGILPLAVKILQWTEHTINLKDFSGQTALHLAARSGHEAVVQLLLEKGADVNAKDESLGRTVMH